MTRAQVMRLLVIGAVFVVIIIGLGMMAKNGKVPVVGGA